MNEQQTDEIIALTSIYPDQITSVQYEDYLEVKIKLDLDLGEAKDVDVLDSVEKLSKIKSGVGDEEPVKEGAVGLDIQMEKMMRLSSSAGSKSLPGKGGRSINKQQSSNKQQASTLSTPSTPTPSVPRSSIVITLSPSGCTPLLPPPPPTPATAPILVKPLLSPTSLPFSPLSPPPPIHQRLSIRYLPPLYLTARLPSTYPLSQPPTFSLRSVSSAGASEEEWLPPAMVALAEKKLAELWQEGEECLWGAIDFFVGESIISTLELEFPLHLEQAASTSQQPLSTLLLSHNHLSHSSVFQSTSNICGICLSSKKGSHCVRLIACGDVFCIDCLKVYFTLLITEGLVRSIHCPSVSCTKLRSLWERKFGSSVYSNSTARSGGGTKPGEVGREELKEIVGEELTKRSEELLEKMRVDSDLSFSRCPRLACQAAVAANNGSKGEGDNDEGESKLRSCGECGYSYCVFCRRGWHGTINPCSIPSSSLVVTAYLTGSPTEKLALELKYGTSNIRRLVTAFEEDRLNREWIEKNSMRCPGCNISVERTEGCQHMQCSRCQIHFCYRCGSKISALDPYLHYSTPGLGCYNKLFEGQPTPDWLVGV